MGDTVRGAEKLDRRVRRTHERLREAIVELVLDKGYQNVTVDHLVERADVTRATFYAHFRDKEHLFATVADDLVSEVLAEFGGDALDPAGRRIELLFELAGRRPEPFRAILRGEGDGVALRRLRDHIVEIAHETHAARHEAYGLEPRVSVDVLAVMLAGELLSLLGWWVEQDDDRPPAAEVVTEMRAATLYGRLWATGLDPHRLTHPELAAMCEGLPPREETR